MKNDYLFRIYFLLEVTPDGNCLFAAVVDQLRIRGMFGHTARSLRTATVRYLREHPTQVRWGVEASEPVITTMMMMMMMMMMVMMMMMMTTMTTTTTTTTIHYHHHHFL